MSDEKPVSRDANRFIIRFPPGMRDAIAQLAEENNRSMNAEIVARLAASMQERNEMASRIDWLANEVDFLQRAIQTMFGIIARSASPEEVTEVRSRLDRTEEKGPKSE
jgi:hypothetical protein